MKIDALVKKLKSQDWYNDQIEIIKEIQQKEAAHAELKEPLPEQLQRYLVEQSIKLYTHQVEAIERIRAGENVAITTPTASGKTLAFNLPIFEQLCKDRKATALYLYPLKALANDQLKAIRDIETATRIDLNANVYDGDTPAHIRPRIRENSRIVLSNPYALHQYLPWHHKWRRFFKNLKFIVIDEAHRYRGVFGSNVAMLIRRLRRILDYYSADPQFVLSSATFANAEEHAKKLTGKRFVLIAEDGSAHGPKYFIFWNPLKHLGRSVHRQTGDLLTLHVSAGLQTLCFTISRALAELVARWAREDVPQKKITAYRAGYLPEERREIERGLKQREIAGVASTNALELGMDIGGLDSVIISGYPGTVISTWQQAGRAGRGRDPAVVTLVAFENPLDQYFMKHPQEFFERPHEHAIIDLENEHILMGQLMCAAAELPLKEPEERFFGRGMKERLNPLEKENLLQKTPLGWIYKGVARPVDMVSLDSISDQTVEVICEGELLETIDLRRACWEVHPGAVFLHLGETYLVKELDPDEGVAIVAKEDVDYYTEPLETSEVTILQEREQRRFADLKLSLGEVHVRERVIGYRVRKYDHTVGVQGLDLSPIDFETVGLWFTLPKKVERAARSAGRDWAGGLHGAEHALIAMTPFYAMCDRWDIGGVSTPFHQDTGRATIFIYDAFPGGIGISEKACSLFEELTKATYKLIKDCPCEEGCPSCIYSPKCGNRNEPLDKEAALMILIEMLGMMSSH